MNDFNIWFSMVKIPSQVKLQLIKEYETAEDIWNSLVVRRDVNNNYANMLKGFWDDRKIDAVKNIMFKNQIKIIGFNDKEYPSRLKKYDDAPVILYYKGSTEKLDDLFCVSIVGSRKCSNYGIDVTKIISSELAKNNVAIISGMAKGIDFYAHEYCIENDGYTCGVLGCGIDIVYPRENMKLYNRIAISGCLLSEFPPGTEPFAYNFPMRNRIISGLSDLVIVIEAGIKSGSLITANLALDKGIDVMAVPGSIFSEHSRGCNKLIKDGAYPVTSLEDIFELTGIKHDNIIERKACIHFGIEKQIYGILNDNPIHIDDIIKLANIDIKQLYEVLFELQLKEEIMCLAGNYYVKVNKTI